jgi:hypothetical protein
MGCAAGFDFRRFSVEAFSPPFLTSCGMTRGQNKSFFDAYPHAFDRQNVL